MYFINSLWESILLKQLAAVFIFWWIRLNRGRFSTYNLTSIWPKIRLVLSKVRWDNRETWRTDVTDVQTFMHTSRKTLRMDSEWVENNFDIINISISTAERKKELSRFEQEEGAISARALKKALFRLEQRRRRYLGASSLTHIFSKLLF